MLKTLKAKLYPNAAQACALVEYLDQGRYVFNQALAQRRDVWVAEKRNVGEFDQCRTLTCERANDERLRNVPLQVERDALRRVDLAFAAFFRRVKAKVKKCGYPRFKSRKRYNSFSIGGLGCRNVVKNGKLKVSGIDTLIRCRGLQPVVGEIKSLTIVRRAGEWFARILIDDGMVLPPLRDVESAIGIDLGLHAFVATSNGETVECPKHYRRMEGRDFTHKLSRKLVNEHQLIVAEKLNITGMVRSKLAKSILDAGWSRFTSQLTYKAERAGCQFVQVNPHNTSQMCSECGQIVPKDLSVRVHECECGLVLDRDVNAARNILTRGLSSTFDEVIIGQYVETCKTSSLRGGAKSLKRAAQLRASPNTIYANAV